MQPMISEGARAVVADSIDRMSFGEEVNYEVFMTIMQTPQGMGVSLVVLLAIRGLVLNERMIAPIMFGNPMPPAEEIDKQVQMTLTNMRAEKARAVAQANNGTLPGLPKPNGEGS
jgi:hypothetical protein